MVNARRVTVHAHDPARLPDSLRDLLLGQIDAGPRQRRTRSMAAGAVARAGAAACAGSCGLCGRRCGARARARNLRVGEAGIELVRARPADRSGPSRPCRRACSVPSRVALAVSTSRISCASAFGWRFEQQRRDAADMGGRDRGSGGELIGVGRRRNHHVDAGRRDRDLRADIRALVELVVLVDRRDADHVRVGRRIERRRLRPLIADGRDQDGAFLRRLLQVPARGSGRKARQSSC